MKYLTVMMLMVAGSVKVNGQQLASEKPVSSYYSKTTQQNLDNKARAGQPAAMRSRQALASDKAAPQPSRPARIKITKQVAQRKAVARRHQLASEKPVDMDRVKSQRALSR